MNRTVLSACMAMAALFAAKCQPVMAQDKTVSTFNSANVLLPSSQYTPATQYEADAWVCNTGLSYDEQYYNNVWGTPPDDANGRAWFDPDYELTDGDIEWTRATSPFSSDEYYKGKKSCQWITSDITGDIYLRRQFTVESPIEGDVFLSAGHDDAPAEWYINGTLVHQVPDGWNNDEYTLLTDEEKALIRTDGTLNVLAVHVHQNYGGAFADCGLYVADITHEHAYLATVDDGEWNCLYYLPNYNDDITTAESESWYADGEDERDWVRGVGPFSNDENKFLVTEWPSQVRPLLIRRHFTLTADDLGDIADGTLIFTCSYDENPKVYLNGTLIWSRTGYNDNDYAQQTLTSRQKKMLREGDNVMAVSLQQGEGGGHVDFGLKLSSTTHPTAIVNLADQRTDAAVPERIYNLGGQLVGTSADTLSNGIYIQKGRKIIVNK